MQLPSALKSVLAALIRVVLFSLPFLAVTIAFEVLLKLPAKDFLGLLGLSFASGLAGVKAGPWSGVATDWLKKNVLGS
jgi:hypothetical protein